MTQTRWRHGYTYGYDKKGCRCDLCTEAQREAQRRSRASAKAEGRPRYFRALATSREAKRGRTGTCIDCGTTTRYNGHGTGVSARCVPCGNAHSGLGRIGTGPVTTKALEFLNQPRRFKELRDHLGVYNGYASQLLHRLRHHGLVTRISRGVYQRTDAL
jgi:hypothetical protein